MAFKNMSWTEMFARKSGTMWCLNWETSWSLWLHHGHVTKRCLTQRQSDATVWRCPNLDIHDKEVSVEVLSRTNATTYMLRMMVGYHLDKKKMGYPWPPAYCAPVFTAKIRNFWFTILTQRYYVIIHLQQSDSVTFTVTLTGDTFNLFDGHCDGVASCERTLTHQVRD